MEGPFFLAPTSHKLLFILLFFLVLVICAAGFCPCLGMNLKGTAAQFFESFDETFAKREPPMRRVLYARST
jgi:hypothetical protein